MFFASLAVFFVAMNMSGLIPVSQIINIPMARDHARASKIEVVDDSKALLEMYADSLKVMVCIVVTSVPLSILFWTAKSPVATQPAFFRISLDSKTVSPSLIIPLLLIATLVLCYFLQWGWSARFHGRIEEEEGQVEEVPVAGGLLEDNEEKDEEKDEKKVRKKKKKKKKMSWRGVVKLVALMAFTVTLLIGFDFVFVFYVANDPSVSPAAQALVITILAQAKR
jgi:Mg2+/citrate symporter